MDKNQKTLYGQIWASEAYLKSMVVVQIELVVLFEYFLQTSWLFVQNLQKQKPIVLG